MRGTLSFDQCVYLFSDITFRDMLNLLAAKRTRVLTPVTPKIRLREDTNSGDESADDEVTPTQNDKTGKRQKKKRRNN